MTETRKKKKLKYKIKKLENAFQNWKEMNSSPVHVSHNINMLCIEQATAATAWRQQQQQPLQFLFHSKFRN